MSDHATVLYRFSRTRPTIQFPRGLARRLALMWEARRTRRILAGLDARQLKDIGVSRSEAEAEGQRARRGISGRGDAPRPLSGGRWVRRGAASRGPVSRRAV